MQPIPEGYVVLRSESPKQTAERLRRDGVPVVLLCKGSKCKRPVYARPEWVDTIYDAALDPMFKMHAIRVFGRATAEWCAAALTVFALGGADALSEHVAARNADEMTEALVVRGINLTPVV